MAVGASASLAARHQGSFIAGAMDADDGPDPIAVGCRDLGIAQFAGAASLADPFGDRPRLARWQNRLNGLNRLVAQGCNCNRDTVEAIRAAGFTIEKLDRDELKKVPPTVRPLVIGAARRG